MLHWHYPSATYCTCIDLPLALLILPPSYLLDYPRKKRQKKARTLKKSARLFNREGIDIAIPLFAYMLKKEGMPL